MTAQTNLLRQLHFLELASFLRPTIHFLQGRTHRRLSCSHICKKTQTSSVSLLMATLLPKLSPRTISRYARIARVINVQKLYEPALRKLGRFWWALDMSARTRMSFLDIFIRHVRLLAVPAYKRHTAAVIFDTRSRVSRCYAFDGGGCYR